MEELIKKFPTQFTFEPDIVNADNLKPADKFIVAGMGGSHLAAGFLKITEPRLDLLIHRDYGLPRVPDYFLSGSLLICSSYSGNTEETLSVFKSALDKNLNLAVVSSGGELLRLAEVNQIPFIKIPSGWPPRLALGFSLIALLKLIGHEAALESLKSLATNLDVALFKQKGEELAGILKGKIPVIYSSTINLPLAYVWKAILNETGKTPTFYNIFPELNHNEVSGFDFTSLSAPLAEKFTFLFLRDPDDHPQIQKRFALTESLYNEHGLRVKNEDLLPGDPWLKIFTSFLIASWTGFFLAKFCGVDPKTVPMIEDFKKRLTA